MKYVTFVPDRYEPRIIMMKVVLAVVAEHLLLLLKAIMIGLIDKRPRAVREAQAVIALKEKEERKELHRKASGLPVRTGECSLAGTTNGRMESRVVLVARFSVSPKWVPP